MILLHSKNISLHPPCIFSMPHFFDLLIAYPFNCHIGPTNSNIIFMLLKVKKTEMTVCTFITSTNINRYKFPSISLSKQKGLQNCIKKNPKFVNIIEFFLSKTI